MDTTVIPSFIGWPDLPTDCGDINTLLRWSFEHDADWTTDALWLRYIKLARRMYSGDGAYASPAEWAEREALFDETRLARQKPVKNPPLPFTILPSIPPSDGTDHLSALPYDLRFQVLSHLVLPYINPKNRKRKVTRETGKAINELALVSKKWHAQVEAFCGHTLLVWKHDLEGNEDWGGEESWVQWRELVMFTSSARMELVVRMRYYCPACGQLRNGSLRIRMKSGKTCFCSQLEDEGER